MDKESYESQKDGLRELIDAETGLSQTKFANDYYCYVMGTNDISEEELALHADRFSKLLRRNQNSSSPERLLSYLQFFKEKYCKDGTHTPFDRDAAWSMYVELDSRIATQDFLFGDVNSALSSLATLFRLNREISKQYGHRCRRYYALTNVQLNEHLRPFTSKYHEKISKSENIAPDEFKEELTLVQGKLKELKDKLFDIVR